MSSLSGIFTINPSWQPKLWERVRPNPSANWYLFDGQTSNNVSKRFLDSVDEAEFDETFLLGRPRR
ncbi:hypothetical protein PDIG_74730 [Penicillium digitatum PHI26]|uniref:Uncharacterized protein n=2 Tax=Penicillium digitatum TaxID=36651 RepID=K9FD82_PEND2|nr:hypothetical protein PDIP_45200 [Penicillium digitatum Pd1]EKV07199.1 hypothetical protein PDIG_74730 [Penicillium digitatum PHI26]EKV14122.1 hypothetical protein PDIP_45200 [Penicillium digitatum Pd1]